LAQGMETAAMHTSKTYRKRDGGRAGHRLRSSWLLHCSCWTLLVVCTVPRHSGSSGLRACPLGPSFTGLLWPSGYPVLEANADKTAARGHARKESLLPQRAEGQQGESSTGITGEMLAAGLSKAKAALRDAPLAPEMAVMQSPTLRQTVAVLHRYLQVTDEIALQAMAEKLTVQLNSGNLDIDDLMGDVAKWEPTRIATQDVRAALNKTATLFTLGTRQAVEAVVEDVADDGNLTAMVNGEAVRFQLGRCADQLMWGPFTRFTVCYAPDYLNGKRVVFMELQDSGQMGVMKIQPGDRMFLADPDRAVILDFAEFEKLPAVAENYLESVRGLRERGLLQSDQIVGVDQALMEAIQFWNMTRDLAGDAKEEAFLERALASPLGQQVSQLVARDDQWKEVLAALQPKGRQLYIAARSALLRQFPADAPEPITLKVERVTLPEPSVVVLTLLAAAVAIAVVCLGGDDLEQDNLPLYTLQKDAPQTTSQLRLPLGGTPLAPFS